MDVMPHVSHMPHAPHMPHHLRTTAMFAGICVRVPPFRIRQTWLRTQTQHGDQAHNAYENFGPHRVLLGWWWSKQGIFDMAPVLVRHAGFTNLGPCLNSSPKCSIAVSTG